MANSTVANILTDVHYDLKLGSSDQTSRQAELISYINRVLRNGLLPTLIRFESDYGLTEWTTTETTGNVRQYSLPTGFVVFNSLYCIDDYLTGTATDGSTTTIVLDEDGDDVDDTDDVYNGYIVRGVTGDAADLQSYIYDYDGDTVTGSLSPAIATAFATDDTYVIFKPPEASNELEQMNLRKLLNNYNTTCSMPEAYAIDDNNGYIVLGGIPDSSSMALYGFYYALPTKLTTTTATMPYDPIFDEVVRSAVTQIGMNRDEYDTQVETGIMSMVQQEVQMLLRYRGPGYAQSKIRSGRSG